MKRIGERRREPRNASPQYVVARRGKGSPELLCILLEACDKALPVFSFEELAQGFVEHRALEREWYVRESHNGEMVSLLLGPCTDVERVLPNLLPDPLAAQETLSNSIDREAFIDFLLGKKLIG